MGSNRTFEVGSLETQNFVTGIVTPISPSTFKYFLDSGLDYRAAFLLFVSGMRYRTGDRNNELIMNAPLSPRYVCYSGVGRVERGALYNSYYIVNVPRVDNADKGSCTKHGQGVVDDSEPEFFAFLRIINRMNPVFANQYTDLKRVGPRLSLQSKDFKDIAGLGPVGIHRELMMAELR